MTFKTKSILKWTPSIVVAFFVMMSASFKLAGFVPLVKQFMEMGLVQYLKAFGLMELTFMALFLHPRTIKIGCLLLTAYFGGALAVELAIGDFIAGPLVILVIIWIAAYQRKPDIFRNGLIKERTSPQPHYSMPVSSTQ